MTADPRKLSDDALCAALEMMLHRLAYDQRLGPRTAYARLKAEYDRRIEILTLEQMLDASA